MHIRDDQADWMGHHLFTTDALAIGTIMAGQAADDSRNQIPDRDAGKRAAEILFGRVNIEPAGKRVSFSQPAQTGGAALSNGSPVFLTTHERI